MRPRIGGLLADMEEPTLKWAELSDDEHIEVSLSWFRNLQRKGGDGGIPAKFRLADLPGRNLYPSYPETSGYILSTILAAQEMGFGDMREMSRLIKSYLLKQQLDKGGFRGGHARMRNNGRASIFNSGQILLGLVAYHNSNPNDETVVESIRRCVEWGRKNVKDGKWNEEYTFGGQRAYYARSTMGFLRGSVAVGDKEACQRFRENYVSIYESYFDDPKSLVGWGFKADVVPLHTIAYTLRGMLECGLVLEDESYMQEIADFCWQIIKGAKCFNIAGIPYCSYSPGLNPVAEAICPTGLAQLAIVLWKLEDLGIGEGEFENAAKSMTNVVKQTQIRGSRNILLDGAVPGSWPVNGPYQPYDLVNWSVKFLLDCLLLKKGFTPKKLIG
ncbi:hypothetical protein N8592_00870 [Verrucomicrobia bacterium]|nr:hypothetical protein [Verrucomicrobiota bacterium]